MSYGDDDLPEVEGWHGDGDHMTPDDVIELIKRFAPTLHTHGDESPSRVWTQAEIADGLKELRKKFPPAKVGKKPQPYGAQKNNEGECSICGRWHKGANGFHVDYVSHVHVMDRLDSVDPLWELQLHVDPTGTLIRVGGAILGTLFLFGGAVRRTDVGEGSSAKAAFSDLIKRTAMRVGVARDLWDKDDLGWDDDTTAAATAAAGAQAPAQGSTRAPAQQPAQAANGRGRAQQAAQTPEDRVRVSLVNRLNRMSTEDRKSLRAFMAGEGRPTGADKWAMADMERVNEWLQGDVQPPAEAPETPPPAEEEPF